ncbi:hypothetical protein [Marinomonas communis]|uniref:hypothetical protein n=1 Tax=Marinomonas communis TaxID=28254 RepID=UPI001B85E112|nr:hypothetical protein [Marinomonas communis]
MKLLKQVVVLLAIATSSAMTLAQDMSNGADNFYVSDSVNVEKVRFKNLYQMEVVGNLFVPKNVDSEKKLPCNSCWASYGSG